MSNSDQLLSTSLRACVEQYPPISSGTGKLPLLSCQQYYTRVMETFSTLLLLSSSGPENGSDGGDRSAMEVEAVVGVLDEFFSVIAAWHADAKCSGGRLQTNSGESCPYMSCHGRCEIATRVLHAPSSSFTMLLFTSLVQSWVHHTSPVMSGLSSSASKHENVLFWTYFDLIRRCECMFDGPCPVLRASLFPAVADSAIAVPSSLWLHYENAFEDYVEQIYCGDVQSVPLTNDTLRLWFALEIVGDVVYRVAHRPSPRAERLSIRAIENLIGRCEVEEKRIDGLCQSNETICTDRVIYEQHVGKPLHVLAGMLKYVSPRPFEILSFELRQRLCLFQINLLLKCNSGFAEETLVYYPMSPDVILRGGARLTIDVIRKIAGANLCCDPNLTNRHLLHQFMCDIVDGVLHPSNGVYAIPIEIPLARYMCESIGYKRTIDSLSWMNYYFWIADGRFMVRHLDEIEHHKRTEGEKYRPFCVDARLGNFICNALHERRLFRVLLLVLASGIHEDEWKLERPTSGRERVLATHSDWGRLFTPGYYGLGMRQVLQEGAPVLVARGLDRIRLLTFLCFAMQTRHRMGGVVFADRMLLRDLFSEYLPVT